MNLDGATLLEVKRLFTAHPLFLLGLLLLVGYGMGKLALRVRLPEITGFILAGLLVSPFTTGIVRAEMNPMLHMVTEVAIGFLALTIGSEFSVPKLRRMGRAVAKITVVVVAGTFGLVLLGCLILDPLFPSVPLGHPYAMLLAVIACATSPAIIVAEVHHLRAHGRFIDYLFGVVALTDAITVVLFGLALTLFVNLFDTTGGYSLLGRSLAEVVYSVVAGLLCAVPFSIMVRRIRSANEVMIVTIGFVFILTGAAIALHLSPLLMNMALGAAMVNLATGNHRIFRALEPFTPPIYALFFVIAGLEIDPYVFWSGPVMVAAGGYILIRGGAKYLTTRLGCHWCATGPAIERHLGLCMFAKGGIALGFVLLIQTSPVMDGLRDHPEIYGNLTTLVNMVLISIFVNELVSPIFLRYAVVRGNEMEP